MEAAQDYSYTYEEEEEEAKAPASCPLDTDSVVDIILLFTEKLTEVKFYAYQAVFSRRLIDSVLSGDGATITALWSRQCGKTETVANVTVGLAVMLPTLAKAFPGDPRFMPFKKGFLVGIYAPIDHQAKISFSRMRSVVTRERGELILGDPEIDVELTINRSDTLGFSNGSRIMAKSASPETQIEGDTHHLVICEESQKLSRTKVEKEISPMLASTNGTMVKIGTAWHSRGGFHVSIHHNNTVFKNGGPRNHFEFDYLVVIAEKQNMYDSEVRETGTGDPRHLYYEKYVKEQIRKLGGIDSEEFKMNFRCLWQESRIVAINMGRFRKMALTRFEAGTTRQGFQVAGLDIGKTNDATVLTVGLVDRDNPITDTTAIPGSDGEVRTFYRKTILDWLELYGDFTGGDGQYQNLINYLAMTNVKVLAMDATAIGNPVYEHIASLLEGSIVVIPVIFSSLTKHNLYKNYLHEVNSGRLSYVAGPSTRERIEYTKFGHEHEVLDKVSHGNFTTCEAAEGEHDDYPDSSALMCWAEKMADTVIMPEIEVTYDNNAFRSSRNGRYGRRG